MRYKSARAATHSVIEPQNIPLGSPSNGRSAQHGLNQQVILQRTGLRPLRFNGALIASADRNSAPCSARIRLALYRSEQRDFVAAWSCTALSPAGKNVFCYGAERFTTLHAAITVFEEADPAVAGDAMPPDAGIAATLQHAAAGVAHELAISAAFGCAVGMFLYELCMVGETSFDDV